MKIEDLKAGNVIEVESGEKFVVGLNRASEMVLRRLVLPTWVFEFEIVIENLYDCSFRAKDAYFDKYDIFRIYEDISCLVDNSVKPIWGRDLLHELKLNDLIWVRDCGELDWRLAMFKGVHYGGKEVLATSYKNIDIKGVEGSFSWSEWKLFSMDDLKEGN